MFANTINTLCHGIIKITTNETQNIFTNYYEISASIGLLIGTIAGFIYSLSILINEINNIDKTLNQAQYNMQLLKTIAYHIPIITGAIGAGILIGTISSMMILPFSIIIAPLYIYYRKTR